MSNYIQHDSVSDSSLFAASWFRDAIMYEVFVRSFRDSNGDGIGDLRGVMDGLDYIQSLGANVIWLMPIHPSPSYHGYDVSDYYTIHPDFGTMEDMLALIDEVHARGMYIIMDYVANHSAHTHHFFQDAFGNPSSNYSHFYKWADANQTAFLSFAGVRSMPEINYDHPKTRQYMIDVATFWLDPNGDGDPSDGVDGFRCDVAIGPPLDFWADLRRAMRAVSPDSLLLGEVWLRSGLQFQDYLGGETFNSLFDFPTFHSLIADHDINGDGAVSGQSSFEFPQIALNNADTLYSDEAHLVRFINNHDTNRFLSEVKGDLDRAKAGAVWLLTVPGTPMLYYGEEIGMLGSKGDGGYYDEYRREPMDWVQNGKGEFVPSWFQVDESHNSANDGISVEEQDNDASSLLNHYRVLGAFRRTTPALRGNFGTIRVSPFEHDLYAVWRGDLDSDLVLVFINFSTQAITAKMIDDRLGSESLENWKTMFAAGFKASGSTLTLDAAGYAVLMRTDS